MRYLTVQDMLWLNLQLAKTTGDFDVERLEEATFYQYAYGDSRGLAAQAARFLNGFNKLSPFARGNDATAFIGMVAFIEANGMEFQLSDEKATEWLSGVWADPGITVDAIKVKLAGGDAHMKHGVPDMHEICEVLIERFPKTLSGLTQLESAPERA